MNDDRDTGVDTTPTPPAETATEGSTAASEPSAREPADLETIEADLAGVEMALERLDAGTYWSDEVTGDPIPDEVLASDPVARRTTSRDT